MRKGKITVAAMIIGLYVGEDGFYNNSICICI